MSKEATIEEIVLFLMRTSKHGMLAEVFIVEAIRFYSNIIAAGEMPNHHGKGAVSAISWYEIGKDIQEKLKEFNVT